jgi:hypothetical protein
MMSLVMVLCRRGATISCFRWRISRQSNFLFFSRYVYRSIQISATIRKLATRANVIRSFDDGKTWEKKPIIQALISCLRRTGNIRVAYAMGNQSGVHGR